MERQRTPEPGQITVPADVLDRNSFYEQHSSLMAQALHAVETDDDQAVRDVISELDLLSTTNPLLSHELETRWEATDADL